MKIVRTDCELECPLIDQGLRVLGVEVVLLPDGISEDDLIAATCDADIILMCYTPITARVIDAASKRRGIVKYGVGIDAIDIPAAMRGSVPVVNVPQYGEGSVAEGAFALMIGLARKLTVLDREMHARGWVWPTENWMGSDIAGKTVGLVGFGRIGRNMARMAGAGFQARVIAFDPFVSAEEMKSAGVTRFDDLREMAAECDFLSIHTVLNDETRHLVSDEVLRAMKPTSVLINVSRGALVDEDALVRALVEARIGGAGLDVYSQEPLSKRDHPMRALYDLPNVILLPHLAFYTADAMERLEAETLQRCSELIERRPVVIKSTDPRLRAQTQGVVFEP